MPGMPIARMGDAAWALVIDSEGFHEEYGNIIQGSPNVFCEGQNMAGLTDQVQYLTTVGFISGGVSPTVFNNGLNTALLMSTVSGGLIIFGYVIQGSTRTFA